MAYKTTPNATDSITTLDWDAVTDAIEPTKSTNDLSSDVYVVLDLLFNCVIYHLLAVFGILGNIFNVVVLYHNGLQSTTNIMLISLSVSDFGYSILMSVKKLKCVVYKYDPPMALTYQTFTNVFLSSLASTMIVISIFIVTIISVERLIAVSFPLHVARIFTPKNTKRTVAVTYLFAFGLMSPWFFRTSFSWSYDAAYNATVAMETYTSFYRDNYYAIGTYVFGVLNVFCSIVTLFIISLSSLLIVVQLQYRILKSTKSNVQELKVFKMLLVVCFVTFMVWVPTAVLDFYQFYATVPEKTGLFIKSIKQILYQLSCGVNFIIFVTTSSKFSATYKQLFHCH
ncbi:chemerin-like receptor 1 [Physella acuta]|uniref:chemerin-like receptor 1 n=1 Tax=Physella acuta TaxID=109671 RepID=UPI0027DB7A5F|nr:chemerin-like receptor 1 [Physella acuta]